MGGDFGTEAANLPIGVWAFWYYLPTPYIPSEIRGFSRDCRLGRR